MDESAVSEKEQQAAGVLNGDGSLPSESGANSGVESGAESGAESGKAKESPEKVLTPTLSVPEKDDQPRVRASTIITVAAPVRRQV
tara:strand:- start:1045 stop:1302 length:258 start_codon:yes stop_codon:yes gene_type:complete